MTSPNGGSGRYFIPSHDHETTIQADRGCGTGWDVPERDWNWISDQHHRAHGQGRDWFPAGQRIDVTQTEPGQAPQRWSEPSRSPQQEPEAAG
jgi:hypothetical protein